MEQSKLPTHVRITLGELFAKYDLNQNGTLERNQIHLALTDIFKRLGVHNGVTEADVDNFIKDYDKNKDGRVSWSDFMNMYALNFYSSCPGEHLPTEISVPIDEIFAKYDHDKNGLLDYAELTECLQDVFNKLGVDSKATLEDVKEFFKDYDVNGDGQITKADFKKVYAIKFHSF